MNLCFFTFIPEAEDWQVTECLGLTVAQNPSQLSSKVSSFKDQLSPAKDLAQWSRLYTQQQAHQVVC